MRAWVGAGGRRVSVLAAFVLGLLATTTIALAATGVIPAGSPAPPDRHLNPNAGFGAPKPGASRLLPLRVKDPEGGPPWGMRVVGTTRGEVCLQIGRVQEGKLGELGIDGAFHDDGRFHPLPLDALPAAREAMPDGYDGTSTTCVLAGHAISTSRLGVSRSAVGEMFPSKPSATERNLRNVYYGMLGSEALSVTYSDGGPRRTEKTSGGIGAYLIVTGGGPATGPLGLGGESSTSQPGQLAPNRGEPIAAISYRIDGAICQRAQTGSGVQVQHPCPIGAGPGPAGRGQPQAPRELHEPLHVALRVRHDLVTSAQVSFRAPYAVRNAGHYYSIFLPQPACRRSGEHEAEGGVDEPIDRNVSRGATVSANVIYPFLPIRDRCVRQRTTIEVVYRSAEDAQRTIVGAITLHQPPGTRGGPHAERSPSAGRPG